jgi:hypothetical protein
MAPSATRLPSAFALLAASIVLLALPAQGGTADAPEVTDASGDAGLPQLDLAAAWFEANGTTLRVHVLRGPDSGTPPPAAKCQDGACAGTGVAVRVAFAVLRADGTPAPSLTDYAASYVLVRLGVDDPAIAAVAGYYDSQGTATDEGAVTAAADGAAITVDLPLASDVVGLPGGLEDGARVSTPYAASYAMACAPQAGCGNLSPPEQAASLADRAPDSGTGADFWLPAPAAPNAGGNVSETQTSTPASATTVTVVQNQTRTVTRTETQERTATVTIAPNAAATEAKTSPAAGILVAAALVGLAAVRRRLA